MMIKLGLVSFFPRIIIIILIAIEFENSIDIISITVSSPSEIAMYHSTCISYCTCAN